jgi:hypothetical protein
MTFACTFGLWVDRVRATAVLGARDDPSQLAWAVLAWAVPSESQTAMRCACWRATRHMELRYMYFVHERLASILPCMFSIIHTRCVFHDTSQADITPSHSEYPRQSRFPA